MHEIKAISDLLKIDAGQWKAHDEEIAKLEEKQAQRDKLERYQKSGVPERYFNETFDTYKITNKMQATAAKAATNFLHAVKCGEFKRDRKSVV